ncbi:MAG TPA: hypothetical protein PLU93_11025 [Treponemataceae bacterium]|nr:hypothetical protein [Treponemataceae bacterium]
MKNKRCIGLALALIACIALSAQTAGTFRIDSVTYDISGSTREYPLRRLADIDKKRVFLSQQELDVYVNNLRTKLQNERVFESTSVDVSLGQAGADGIVPVSLVVHTKDTWNIIVLPYPKYDSNDGFTIKLKLKDFNFFGSLQTLSADVNYQLDTTGQSSVEANLDFAIPFESFGYGFEWDISASIEFPEGEVPEFHLGTGLDMAIPTPIADLHVGFTQGVSVNDRDSDDVLYEDDTLYFTETLYVNLPITVHSFDYIGDVVYTPGVNFSANWSPEGLTHEDLKGPDASFGHSVGFSRVDWVGNFRRGVEASLSNSYSYDFHLESDPLTVSVQGEVSGFRDFFDRVGVSARAYGLYIFNGDESNTIAKRLRGILDKRIVSDTAMTLNVDIPIRVLRVNFQEMSGVDWTKMIGFEMHWNAFFDMALTHDDVTGRYFNLDDGWYSGGLEIIVYPTSMRSVIGRASVGFDLAEFVKNGKLGGYAERDDKSVREITVAIGLFY